MKTWHQPQQARSRERFNRILASAESLFAEHGYESVTTNHIAEHSGVAIGSVYHFFPDKEAVLGALVERYASDLQSIFSTELSAQADLDAVAVMVIERVVTFERHHVAFSHLLYALDMAKYGHIVGAIHQTVIHAIYRIVRHVYPHMPDALCKRYATISFHLVKGLLPLMATEQDTQAARLEIETALRAYLQAFLQREGYRV
jgi:AcrR family transcriptional regulator